MGGGAGGRRRLLCRRRRRARAAHDLRGRRRQAVDLRLPGRGAAHAGRDAALLRARRRDAGAALRARPLSLSFRSTREVLDAVDSVFRRAGRRTITASAYERTRRGAFTSPDTSSSCRASSGRKVEQPEDWTDALRRAERGRDAARGAIAEEIARLVGSSLPRASACGDGRSSSWCASATPSPRP